MNHHPTAHPYPADLPFEEVRELVGQIRQGFPDKACAAHCCWVVAGYGLGKLLPHQPLIFGAAALSDSDLADRLDALVACQGDVAKQAVLPWPTILVAVLQLLFKLLS